MTLVHDPSELDGGPRPRVPLRHAGARRDVRAGRARPRGGGHRQRPAPRSSCTARARSCPATSSTTTPRSTRPACRRPRPAPRSSDRERATILKIARDAYRAIGGEGFARVDFLVAGETILLSEINTIPGLHADQPLPDDAGRGRLHVRRRLHRGSSSSRSSAHAARRRPAPHARGPASMSGRPIAPARPCAAPRAAGRARSGARRPACRAVRAGAALAMLVVRGRDLRRRRLVGLRRTPTSRSTGATFTDRRGRRGRRRRRPGTNLFGLDDRRRSRRPSRRCRRSRRRTVDVRLPGTLGVDPRGARRRSSSGRSARGATWPTPTARCSRCWPTTRRPARPACPSIDDRRAASAGLSVGRRSTRSTSTPRPGWPRCVPADVGSARASRWP